MAASWEKIIFSYWAESVSQNHNYFCITIIHYIHIDYFMVGECVQFLLTSCEGSRKRTSELNDPSQRVSNKNRTNKPIMKSFVYYISTEITKLTK